MSAKNYRKEIRNQSDYFPAWLRVRISQEKSLIFEKTKKQTTNQPPGVSILKKQQKLCYREWKFVNKLWLL